MGKLGVLVLAVLSVFGNSDSSVRSCLAPASPPLPKPTGVYRIGTSVFHLTDASRPDTLAKKPGSFRELMFQVWFPTDATAKGETAPYVLNAALLEALKETKHDLQEPAVFEAWRGIRTSAVLDAPLASTPAKFPLLFFSHGLSEPRSLYTAFAQDLASHGYLVVAIDHPYGGVTILPDGQRVTADSDPDAGSPEGSDRQVAQWARDASFVLNLMNAETKGGPSAKFGGRIDLTKIGMLGHSLGGAAALEACRADERFKACADLDGAPFGQVANEGVKRPTLVMRSGPLYSDEDLAKRGRTRAQWDEMGRKGQAMWNSFFEKGKGVPIYNVTIKGTGHMSYSDAPFVMPDTINRFGGRIIDANRGFEIITHYLREFFAKYLQGKPSPLLDGAKPFYEEVSAGRINP